MTTPRLIHLNGPPGVGKSTLARRYVAEHPDVLLCDVDVIRSMIGGWQTSKKAMARSRTTALAMVTTYLRSGGDVVVPQLVADPGQLERFAAAAAEADADHVHVVLTAEPEVVVQRLHDRATASCDELATFAAQYWLRQGGDVAIHDTLGRLQLLAGRRVLSSDPEATYIALLAAIGS